MMAAKLCVKCGGTERYSSGDCKTCKQIYSASRKDIKRQYNAEYRKNNAEAIKRARAVKYAANPELYIAQALQYKQAHPERVRATDRKWARANRDKVRAKAQWRNAIKLQAVPKWFGEFDEFIMQEAHSLCKMREQATGFKWHVDHIVPLNSNVVCGLHIGCNTQVIPALLNIKKSNRYWPGMPGELEKA